MSNVARALALGALLAAVPASRAADGPPPVLSAVAAQEAVKAVLPEVEEIRGLRFKSEVPVRVVNDAEAREYVVGRIRELVPETDLRAQESAWRLLGLVPADLDVLDVFLDVLGEQAGGFYSPEKKVFYLLDDMPAGMAPLLAAHELTHALEDQYYDLDARLKRAVGSDDVVFAKSAVHEGSATVVMGLWLARAMAAGTVQAADLRAFAATEAGRAEKLSAMPAVMRAQLIGPYLLGAAFLLRGDASKLASGAIPATDLERAYREGPVSSEQILHPEKFWDAGKRDTPKNVSVADLEGLLGPEWRCEGSGTLGELGLAILTGVEPPSATAGLEAAEPSAWTNAAASGWGGDRWALWTDGARRVLALVTAWDTAPDAREFARALPERPGMGWKVEGRRVALVAGDVEGRSAALLGRLLR